MLDFLDAGLDNKHAAGDDSTGKFGNRSPGTETAAHDDKSRESDP
jgi:hypothetical protein